MRKLLCIDDEGAKSLQKDAVYTERSYNKDEDGVPYGDLGEYVYLVEKTGAWFKKRFVCTDDVLYVLMPVRVIIQDGEIIQVDASKEDAAKMLDEHGTHKTFADAASCIKKE